MAVDAVAGIASWWGGLSAGTQTLISGAAAGAASAGVSALASKGAAPPPVPKPIAMPDPQAQQEAQRRSLVAQLSRSGRASTILSDNGDSLG